MQRPSWTSSAETLAVFSLKTTAAGVIWSRVGRARVNGDGSVTVLLDALPLQGWLHIRAQFSSRVAGELNYGEP